MTATLRCNLFKVLLISVLSAALLSAPSALAKPHHPQLRRPVSVKTFNSASRQCNKLKQAIPRYRQWEKQHLASGMGRIDPALRKDIRRLLRSGKRGPAAFDGDGTLWSGDVGEGFFTWMLDNRHYPAERIPMLQRAWAGYKDGSFSGEKMYELMVTALEGLQESQVEKLADHYFVEHHQDKIYLPMAALVSTLSQAGIAPWVVSGSPRWVVAAGARHFGIPRSQVIGLAVKVDQDGRLTNKVVRPVPWKLGKPKQILKQVGAVPLLVAGNSHGDYAMLKMGSPVSFLNNPTENGSRHARSLGWHINVFTDADTLAAARWYHKLLLPQLDRQKLLPAPSTSEQQLLPAPRTSEQKLLPAPSPN